MIRKSRKSQLNPNFLLIACKFLFLDDHLFFYKVLPNAWKQVQEVISEMNGSSSLRMATKKAGPVVTDQGNLILDVLFDHGINNPKDIEMTINNIPGVLENGLFVDITDKVLVGKIENNTPVVYSPSRAS